MIRQGHLETPSITSSEELLTRKNQMSIIKELIAFLRARKKFWLWPLFIMMALLGSLIVLAKGSAVAPFIYTLF